jgi:AcrR family transcriptional regulator
MSMVIVSGADRCGSRFGLDIVTILDIILDKIMTPRKRSPGRRPGGRAEGLAKAADKFHHGDLAAALVATARAMIEESGHETLTLRNLTSRLGVTQPALYAHFESKNALLSAVVLRGIIEFQEAMMGALESHPDPYEALAACARAYVRFAHAHRGWFRLFASRTTMDELRPAAATQPEKSESRASLRSTLMRIVPADDPQLDDVFRAVWGLAHGLSGLVIERVFQLVQTDEERLAAADAAIGVFVDTLRARYGPAR